MGRRYYNSRREMKFLNSIFFLVGSLLLLNCQTKISNSLELINAEELQEISNQDGMQLVDVRTPAEYENGHIPNAQNIDFLDPKFEINIQSLDSSKPIIIYCQRGSRSAKCAAKLIASGFVKVYDLDGGFAQWKQRSLETKN